MPRALQQMSQQATKSRTAGLNQVLCIAPRADDDLRRLGGRVRMMIRDESGDGGVHFGADSRDDRDLRRSDGAGNDLFVELPKIFQGSTPAREQDDIDAADF